MFDNRCYTTITLYATILERFSKPAREQLLLAFDGHSEIPVGLILNLSEAGLDENYKKNYMCPFCEKILLDIDELNLLVSLFRFGAFTKNKKSLFR